MEKYVILDEKNVKVTLVGMEFEFDTPRFKVLLENYSPYNLEFNLESFVINGFMVEGYLCEDVNKGKKRFEYIDIEDIDWACLSLANIRSLYDISEISASFKLMNNDIEEDYDEDYDEEYYDEETDEYIVIEKEDKRLYLLSNLYKAVIKPNNVLDIQLGTPVLEEKGLKVSYIGCIKDDYSVVRFIFLMSSQMGESISVDFDNMSLNDFMAEYDCYFDCDLAYNTKRFCYLTFEEGFLNEIGVESENDVQTIEFEIKVSSKKSRKTLITSPNIKLYHAS